MTTKGSDDDERTARWDKLARIQEAHRLDGLLIYASMLRRENLRYFTGFNPVEPGALAWFDPTGGSFLLVPNPAEKIRAASSAWIRDIASYDGDVGDIPPTLKKRALPKRLGIAGWESLPLDLASTLLSSIPGLDMIDLTPSLDALRIVKTLPEVQRIRKAAAIADAAFEDLVENLKPGIREYEIVARVECHIRKAQGEDNFQILASSPGDARAMHPPTDRILRDGDLLVTEISPQFEGYFAQICRSVSIGTASPERRRAHDILLRAQEEAMDRVRPGMTASDVARIQNDVFRGEGFAEFVSEKYTRGRGHGIGLYIDEEPLIAEGNDFKLIPGMVIMIHPNTYLPLAGYMVAGDPVLITETGGERLSRSRRELVSIEGRA
jgi:Xaa-Pro dipeptidase